MLNNNVIIDKTKLFAIRIVKLYQFLRSEKKEFILSKQVLKSGTSIGANVREAHCAMSNAEFKAKLNIALKEANETEYWLELLNETQYINEEHFASIYEDCNEINKILTSIIKSLNKSK